jgi:uncharacterized protein YllA (UPF0747 family)
MATEDHDFEEINYFNFKGKNSGGTRKALDPCGRLSTQGLSGVLNYIPGIRFKHEC